MKHLLAVVFLLLSATALAENYVIHAGALFDSVSGKVIEERSIHVADGKIVSVAAGYEEVAAGRQLIDGVTPHGENGKEFVLLVGAGMKPVHALQAATINTAKLLRIEDEAGSIEAGKRADIVAVKGDPLADISLMQNVSFVMKQGKIHKRE